MQLDIYQIDAFTDTLFKGNPACVVPLQSWLPDSLMMDIARENAVAETAFFVIGEEKIHLRWFTPEIEMDLCGHATLAAAHVLQTILNYNRSEITFITLSGDLKVLIAENIYWLDFPARMPVPAELPVEISESLSIQPVNVFKSRDYMLVYENEESVRNLKVNRELLDRINLDPGGIIVTTIGDDCDFVSRYFTPQASILEDPVTGSAHCSLIPYWAGILKKQKMHAKQISGRMGELLCVDNGLRVLIGGCARTYSVGTLFTD